MKRDCTCPRARHVHGTKRAYLYDGCRCADCSAANATAAREYRRVVAERRWNARGSAWTDATGTLRRMQALAAAGWSAVELGRHLGVSDSAVYWLRHRLAHTCLVTTADRVSEIYDRLWHDTPTGNAVERTRLWAARQGWVEPWRWEGIDIDDHRAAPKSCSSTSFEVDEIAVAEVIGGRLVALNDAELTDAVRKMTDMNLTARQLSEMSGASYRQIDYWTRTGRLVGISPLMKSGSWRSYSVRELAKVCYAMELIQLGLDAEIALPLADAIASNGHGERAGHNIRLDVYPTVA